MTIPGAAAVAPILGGHAIPAVANVACAFGTLVGADLLNLPRIRSLRAPAVSIGGAGTFDGVFLTGLAAVPPTGSSHRAGTRGTGRPGSSAARSPPASPGSTVTVAPASASACRETR
jgi:hypothetical protein